MARKQEQLIQLAQRGRAAAALLGELGDPLGEMERRAVNALVMEFRSGEVSNDRLRQLAADISAARKLREDLEGSVRAGRVAGERLTKEE